MTSLTPKQQQFVVEYLVDTNETQAAIRAGYAPKWAANMGSKNLRIPAIAEAIAKKRTKLAAKTELKAEWVLLELRATYERATAAEDWGAALKALDLLGRHLGMFPRDGITIDARTQNLTLDGYNLSREQLVAIAEHKMSGE